LCLFFHQELKVAHEAHSPHLDGFTRYGIRIRHPVANEQSQPGEQSGWLEVSVLGNVYENRRHVHHLAVPTNPSTHPLQNQLVDGTLIDLGGIILMFQDPITMADSLFSSDSRRSEMVMESLNRRKPICPVLFNEIQFSCSSQMDTYRHFLQEIEEQDHFPIYRHHGPIHLPITDYSEVTEGARSYVFPSCGHVYGYHKSIEEKGSCPLCRCFGPFVPLAFALEQPSLFPGFPTHVFNPCGHVGSEDFCTKWGQQQIFSEFHPFPFNSPLSPERTGLSSDQSSFPICPFCATELNAKKPFSKLIFQETETGMTEDMVQFSDDTVHDIRDNWLVPEFQKDLLTCQEKLFNKEKETNSCFQLPFYHVYAPQVVPDTTMDHKKI
jgi:pellino protein